jgi:hypothetical protein
MVAVINSVLAGVFAGMLFRFAFSLPIYTAAGSGLAVFAVSVVVLQRYQLNKFALVESRLQMLFPSD